MMDLMNLHVLAVARPTKGVVCVAGISDSNEWIRPQRILEDDIKRGDKVIFDLFGITKIYVKPWIGKTNRPEDRYLVKERGKLPEFVRYMSDSEIKIFLDTHLDSSVGSAFDSGRTLGLIQPQNILKLSGDINKIYIYFEDDANEEFSWPVRDELFYKKLISYKEKYPDNFIEKMYDYMQKNITYFAIGLTQIYQDNINVNYGGWPMIVGIHYLKGK